MNKIVIITDNFPFKPGENTFILPEIETLKKYYEIEIIAASMEKDKEDFYKKFDLRGIKFSKVKYPKFGIKHKLFILFKCLFSIDYYKNIFSSKCSFKKFRIRESECRNFYLIAHYFHKYLKTNNYFSKEEIDKTIFYSFWSNSNLLALCLEKKKNSRMKIIARANGYDLYNERMQGLHQPYKKFMDKLVDYELFDANLNRKYYIDHFGSDKSSSKYILAYLGVLDRGIEHFEKKDTLKLVSCSSLIPLKRVNLIIEELSLIKDKNIEWIHFGDGELNGYLKDLASKKLGNNIRYEFKGYVDNKVITDYYKNNNIDLFIHLSETEGCPVSLSEAASFGIPIVATDAGGVCEIVNDSNGKLIPINFKSGEVANFINYYASLNNDEIVNYRKNARATFLEKFDEKNNSKKLLELFNLLNKKKVCHVTSAHNRYDGRIFKKECTSLAQKYDVTLLCCDSEKNEIKNNVKIVSINKKFKNVLERMFLSKNYLKRKAIELDADIYQIHDPELISLAKYLKKKGKKIIFDSHEDYPALFLERQWIPGLFRKILKRIYEIKEKNLLIKADYILCASEAIKRRILKFNKNIELIPNFPILDEVQKENNETKCLNICFAGGMGSDWNHDIVVKAIQDLNVKYIVAGSCTQEYKRQLQDLDINNKVVFLGKISYEEVKKLYLKSDIGIGLCSYRPNVNYKEGSIGITKIFEYMMFGLPTIFTNFDVFEEINSKNQFGILVDPKNVEEVKNAIKTLINSKAMRNLYSKNARELVEKKYNWSETEKKLLDVYDYLNNERNN